MNRVDRASHTGAMVSVHTPGAVPRRQSGFLVAMWLCGFVVLTAVSCRGGPSDPMSTDGSSTANRLKEFCDLGVQASRGWVAMDGPVEENPLVKAPGLSPRQRDVVRDAVGYARRQVAAGNGLNT